MSQTVDWQRQKSIRSSSELVCMCNTNAGIFTVWLPSDGARCKCDTCDDWPEVVERVLLQRVRLLACFAGSRWQRRDVIGRLTRRQELLRLRQWLLREQVLSTGARQVGGSWGNDARCTSYLQWLNMRHLTAVILTTCKDYCMWDLWRFVTKIKTSCTSARKSCHNSLIGVSYDLTKKTHSP